MLLRSWLTTAVVIAVVQGVLVLLSVLQHDAIFSELVRKRLAVMAQTVATPFQPFVDLGLPISMARNGDSIVARPLAIDPEITAVHTFNPSGIIVHSTLDEDGGTIPDEVLLAMRLSDEVQWSVETTDYLFSGFNILRDGTTVGGAAIVYPRERLLAASASVRSSSLLSAFLIWVAFSIATLPLLNLLLAGPRRAIGRLGPLADELDAQPPDKALAAGDALASISGRLFGPTIRHLGRNLDAADACFRAASRLLAESVDGSSTPDSAQTDVMESAKPDSGHSLARQVASRLAIFSAFVIVASALLLGLFILRNVNESIAPELSGRTELIGTVVSENVQRAVEAGVPLDGLVGAESYFGDMLSRLPEVAYVAVATGRIVLEAGQRIDPYLAPARQRKDVRSHPIMHEGEEIAYVVIDIDPAFISRRFLDVFLDVLVVVLVTVFVAFEVMVLMTSRSLTAALNHLQRLAAMQASGDFSHRVTITARDAIGRLTVVLAKRSDYLHEQFARALRGARPAQVDSFKRFGAGLGLTGAGPQTLRLRYFTDVRLALFLFAAADQLPLSFLPLYTRAAVNSLPWLNESIVISLPLAGYLLAILIVTPYSRSLAQRFGRRRLMLAATAPTVVAHLGLYFAASVTEIILWRSLTGVGYALVTLACQDYVIDTSRRSERDRALGVFSLVLFAGIFCGAALGGVLADRMGQANVFLLSTALIVISALLIAWLAGDSETADTDHSVTLAGILRSLGDMKFTALVFGIAVPANVIGQAFVSYLVALTLDEFGASTADIGRTLMLYFLAVAVTGTLAPSLRRAGLSAPLLVCAGQLVASGALLIAAAAPGVVTIIAACALAGVGQGVVRGMQVSIALAEAEGSPRHLGAGDTLAALRALERAGSIVGLIVIAAIAGVFGFQWAIATMAALTLAGAAAFAPFAVARRAHGGSASS